LERKQKGEEEVERKERNGGRSSQVGAKTNIAMTPSVAEEAAALSASNNRACSDGRSGEDKCSSGEGSGARSRNSS